jgi:ABC-2 type transport system permease protein
MTALSSSQVASQARPLAMPRLPFLAQLAIMTRRSILVTLRNPAEILPGVIINVFFLLVYNSTLGNASNFLPGLQGGRYIAFILPLSVISAALSGSGLAGQAIVRDIESGYFDKLMLTPMSRAAILLAPMISGALFLVVQTGIVVGLGFLLGLTSATGLVGVLVLMGFSLLIGVAFAGLSVGIALRSGSAGATQGASFLFFPLSFLTATFVPLDLLSGWIKTAATYNPITYVLEATRSVLLRGWDSEIILRGVLSCLLLGAITYGFAISGLGTRLKRK